MEVCILYSGGKDSTYCILKAMENNLKIKCLIVLNSKNNDSYMFQKSGTDLILKNREKFKFDIIEIKTNGEKEKELIDLKNGIDLVKKKYKIKGVVCGTINSNYQAIRIQKICNDLNLFCFNPIWQIDEKKYLQKLIESKMEIKIIKVASFPFDENYLMKSLFDLKEKLILSNKKYRTSLIGEGGEFESLVFFSKKIHKKKIEFENFEIIKEGLNLSYINFK